jgi:hypothetical protein
MADSTLNPRNFNTALMVNTYGYRPGIDIPLSSFEPGEALVWSGTSLGSQRMLPFDIGVYTGAAPAGSTAFFLYMRWISNARIIASDNFARAQWSDVEAPNFIWNGWGPVISQRPDIWLQLTVPLLPDTLPATVAQNWTDGANGVHDAHWNTLGDYIVAKGTLKRLIIRLHHEFNIASIPVASYGNWKTYWKRVVNLLRAKFDAASGITCKFCWNPTNNIGGVDLDALWPGTVDTATIVGGFTEQGQDTALGRAAAKALRSYPLRRRYGCAEVDFIGVDVYDQTPGNGLYTDGVTPTNAQRAGAWASYLNSFEEFNDPDNPVPGNVTGYLAAGSLNYVQRLAQETGTPLCVPEWGLWGVGHGRPAGGDNPIFIYKMRDWMQAAGVSYACYFDYTNASQDAYHQLWPGVSNNVVTDFPLARDAYLSLF